MAPVAPGNYHTSDLVRFMNGRNGEVKNSNAQDGRAHRLMDGLFIFDITPTVQTLVLYRHNYNLRDSIRIRTLDATGGTSCTTQTLTFANTDPVGTWGQPVIVTNIGTCTKVEIMRLGGTGAAAWAAVLERITLLPATSTPLTAGHYDNISLASFFTNATLLTNSAAGDGTWHRLDTGGSLTFTVAPSVVRMMVYRPMDLGRDDLQANMSGAGCTSGSFSVNILGLAPDPMWNIPQAIDLKGCTNIQIIRKFTAGKTDSTGIDAIRLLTSADLAPLGPGNYHTSDLVRFMDGRNGEVRNSGAQDGRAHRLMDGNFIFDVTGAVQGLVLYRHNYNLRDNIRIRLLDASGGTSCSNPLDLTFSNPNTAGDFGQPIVVTGFGTCTKVHIVRVGGSGAAAWAVIMERMELLVGPQPTLTSGNLYQEYDPGLIYPTGTWTASLDGFASNERTVSSNQLNANVTFTTNANGFIVYHRAFTGTSNNVEVCVQTGSNPPVCTNYSTQSSTLINQFPVGIYGLGSGTHVVTITNKHSGGNLTIDAIRIP
jgi:hypothetical protein